MPVGVAVSLEADLSEDQKRALIRRQNATIKDQNHEIEALRRQLDFTSAIDSTHIKVPLWLTPPRPEQERRGVVCTMLTDTHFGEVINPGEIENLNAYNDNIADIRLRRFSDQSIQLARDFVAGLEYDGAVLFLGGDIFSGTIHDELTETNSETLYASVVHWLEPMAGVINAYAEEFGSVHVPCVVGNHGRRTRKPRAKMRAQDNIEWLFYRVLEREFRSDPRVTFQVSDSADLQLTVYSTRYNLTHGDQFRGGSGIAGMFSPLMLGSHRKAKRAMSTGHRYDYIVMGHWHQYWSGKGIIVGGTLKGYDEYAYVSNFDFEEPAQAFWITTPEHGVMFATPIAVFDKEAEGW